MRISVLVALALVQLAVAVSPQGGSMGALVDMELPPMPQKPVFVVMMADGAPPCRIVAEELGFEYLGPFGANTGKHLVTPADHMRVQEAMGLFHDACEIEWGQLYDGPVPEPTPVPTPEATPAPKCPNGTVASANATTAANVTVAAVPGNSTAAGNSSAPLKCVAVANTTAPAANATALSANATQVANATASNATVTVMAANGTLVTVANTTAGNATLFAPNATAPNATAPNATANATLAADDEPVRKVAPEAPVEEFVAEPLEWAAVHLDRAACADAVAHSLGMTNLGPFDVHSRQYDAQQVLDKLALPATVDPESLANDLYVFQKPADMYHSVAIDRLDAEPTVLWRVGPFGCEDN